MILNVRLQKRLGTSSCKQLLRGCSSGIVDTLHACPCPAVSDPTNICETGLASKINFDVYTKTSTASRRLLTRADHAKTVQTGGCTVFGSCSERDRCWRHYHRRDRTVLSTASDSATSTKGTEALAAASSGKIMHSCLRQEVDSDKIQVWACKAPPDMEQYVDVASMSSQKQPAARCVVPVVWISLICERKHQLH